MKLTEWQEELLKETFNLGVGKASASIGELAGCEVELTVPEVQICQLKTLVNDISAMEGSSLSAVIQTYSGPFEGTAMMLYSEEASLDLVRLIMGSDTPSEQLSELEYDALCEVGNIVLNGCLSSLGGLFEAEIETELPELLSGTTKDVLTLEGKLDEGKQVVFLKMGFQVATGKLQGYLSFILDTDKIHNLLECLENYYRKISA
ncbi:chemotaxis protein CheX [Pseudobacteriovorax antillogorgiicola]|uniref:CheC, inhibitor of MCP methylation n=1 Tax=Pseudobacteriovorax antillogorgiicola TaxID=1513793 RepID=A0A1Y6BIG8_9BACT|nr:chemotaxis protein CheX [Pseudobacteriovorax antillogorgiicola]TCS56492.1 CheC inhibitor of MCP methylation [Pseudobacteriovorax antillogorgiicola]SMF04826.1 CheC, inhibitor of MCP methylation [Pseudobacteriovorax antillogorgiicola]